jgi:hypothetical protein
MMRNSDSQALNPVARIIFVCFLLVAASAGVSSTSAQIRHGADMAGINRMIDSIGPRFGPVGTEVAVRSGSMPAITPIRIGFGATTGFEDLQMILTSDGGEFATRARVPAWATWDRTYRFIVLDIYFRPIALSQPFYVTNSDGVISRDGTVRRPSESCVTLQQPGGETAVLSGDVASLATGQHIAVEGRVVSATPGCGASLGIQLIRVRTRG